MCAGGIILNITKDEVIRNITGALIEHFESEQLRIIENTLYLQLSDYELHKIDNADTQLTTDISPDVRAVQMFFVAKKVAGLSDGSLKFYRATLKWFFSVIQKPLSLITANDVRLYLATLKCTTVTANGYRRILSSFFAWLTAEEYISKNPMLKIPRIKEPKTVKKPFSAEEIEELRDASRDKRELAIVDILLSTGMRVGELYKLNRKDVNFASGEVIVTGKGNKQRICYLNAPAMKHLRDYLAERTDDYEPLIITKQNMKKCPEENRLNITGIETMIRELGRAVGLNNVHPHRFRRTAATMALKRGMPIEQVRIMLGHESIDTTLRYAIVSDSTVKHSHTNLM
jgi:site-specific recombinase XerD